MARTVDARELHQAFAASLRGRRSPDGGFAPGPAGTPEIEPTVLATLALDDGEGRSWLAARQQPDGGFDDPTGRPESPSTAALAALVLDDLPAARRALAHAVSRRSLPLPNAPDPSERSGWGWTEDARSLVEPTCRVLTAVKALTPRDEPTRAEALRLLTERRCAEGGWNFGNASVFDVDLRAYPQTTAVALIALQGEAAALVEPGLDYLRRAWRSEPGGLTTAQSIVAFRLHGLEDELEAVVEALGRIAERRSFLGRTVTLAWATLATGPDELLDPLRARR